MSQPNSFDVGDSAAQTRSFSDEDVRGFAAVSQDDNPLHLDSEYAASTRFGQRIVHGMLVASMFSALIARELPGRGTIYIDQSLGFRKPVFLDEPVTSTVRVVEVVKPGLYRLSTIARDAAGDVVIEGEALVMNREGHAKR